MFSRIDPSDELLALAEHQDGALTCAQVAAAGLGRHSVDRLVRDGRWRRVAPGLMTVGAAPPPWAAIAWGGVLLGGPGARLGGLAAAHLYGLTDRPPSRILVLVPHPVRRRSRPPWVFRRERPGVRDPRTIGAPPRITVEDAVIDLCDAGPRESGQSPVHWVTAAVQRRRTTPRRLLAAVQSRTRCAERRLLEDLLAEVSEGAQSALELRYLRAVERAHGLPRGERQSARPAARIEGGKHAYRDVLYRAYGLVVELDGVLGHDGAGRLRDLRRDNISTLRGEQTLRYGWQDVVDEPCTVAGQVASVLARGGWTGSPRRCRRCPGA